MMNISISGSLTKDSELRQTPQGSSVCSFSVAVTDRSSKDKETYYFDVSYWGKAGQAVQPYLKKGTKVSVAGRFGWRDYNNNKFLMINCNDLTLMGGGKSNSFQQSNEPPKNQNMPIEDDLPF